MKPAACILSLFLFYAAIAQKNTVSFYTIDHDVMRINSNRIDELSEKLTAGYTTDLEKVRAIFAWEAQNITYNYKPGRNNNIKSKNGIVFPVDEEDNDSISRLKTLDQVVAENVLKKRVAVCDGYARLFKTICLRAGITCEVINGYARSEMGRIGRNFKSNHSWNAVLIDGKWQLLDVTWSSGYFLVNSNEYVSQYTDQYFLTDPEQFAQDHFPEEPQWALLPQPPVMREFQNSPFKGWSIAKYNILSYFPSAGIIKAQVGDTILLQFEMNNLQQVKKIGGGYFTDSFALTLPQTVFLKPADLETGNIVHYSFVVPPSLPQWLQLIYNDDLVLRYKLDIRDKKM